MKSISREARRRALVARHHLDGEASSFMQVVNDLIAVHSSDPITPHLGLWSRVKGYTPAQLVSAMPHDVWRLHAMRRTLWVVPSPSVGLLDAAVGQTVLRKERKRLLTWVSTVRDDAEAWLDHLGDAVVAAVAAQPGIHTRQLGEAIPELSTRITVGSGKWTSEVPVGSRLLYCLAMELRVARTATSGSWKASQYGWCESPDVARPTADEGRQWLVRCYLDRFAPVTTTDIRWWTGLTAAQVRKALSALHAEEIAVDDGEAWMLAGQVLPEASGICLLPGLDPSPMGYKERQWFLGDHLGALFDRNGNIGPSLWVDGRIVGGWAVDEEGQVHTRLLEHVSAHQEDAIARKAEALGLWLDGVSVTPRFRTPLERELAG